MKGKVSCRDEYQKLNSTLIYPYTQKLFTDMERSNQSSAFDDSSLLNNSAEPKVSNDVSFQEESKEQGELS